jgi:hypothetical protein
MSYLVSGAISGGSPSKNGLIFKKLCFEIEKVKQYDFVDNKYYYLGSYDGKKFAIESL